MKKLLALLTIFLLLGTISVSADTVLIQKKPVISQSGSFTGEIGDIVNKTWKKVGDISGTYEQKNKICKFSGNWEITEGKFANNTGTMKGVFGKIYLFGRITISGSGKKAPIVGFIKVNETSMTFSGRFMSVVGPALYFKGTYQ